MIKNQKIQREYFEQNFATIFSCWLPYFSYISRINNTARTCFLNLKHYLINDDFDANYTMSVFCFECFPHFLCNFLYDDFYTLDLYRRSVQ